MNPDALILDSLLPARWRAGFAWPDRRRDNAGEFALFRRVFDGANPPPSCRLFVTADSRYILHVNGQRVGRGPLKGTLSRYTVEEYEIAPLLKPGRNVLAVAVLWFGYNGPLSEEHSGFPGLLVQGPESLGLDTPGKWKAFDCAALTWDRTPYTCNAHLFMGGMEQFDGRLYPQGWETPEFDDSDWPVASAVFPLTAAGGDPEAGLVWNFVPRELPALTEEPRAFTSPPTHTADEFLLQTDVLTTGYPVLVFEGGAGRRVEILYSENVWHRTEKPDDGRPYLWGGGGRLEKGVRDDLEKGILQGYQDTVILPGGVFTYEPFHWRTFRYVRVRVLPGEEPCTLRDASYRFTTYPQTLRAEFKSGEPDIETMMEVSWRTLQLCSHETYEDCPGYEQLNYLYDARNEALLSMYLCGETALPKRTIRLFRDTLRPDGMLSSRTPSSLRQTIPLFALWWIPMVRDLYDWAGDREREFVRGCLITVDAVLSYFRNLLRQDGFLAALPYWNPIGGDDAPGTDVADALRDGGSVYATALFLYALETARFLHRAVGYAEDVARWEPTRRRLLAAVRSAWSEKREVFVERVAFPEAPVSQHTQAMAILAGAVKPGQRRRLVRSIRKGVPAAKMTLQQGLPFAQAMREAGEYDVATAQYLPEYRAFLDLHLTTWPESTGPGVRSDCHAWSAWLPVEFLSTVLGVVPRQPGFASIGLRPHPVFADAAGRLMTPEGEVAVAWRTDRKRFRLEARTPVGVPTYLMLPDGSKEAFPQGGNLQAECLLPDRGRKASKD